MAEEDDEMFGGLYEGGHWVWDNNVGVLTFMSNVSTSSAEEGIVPSIKLVTTKIEFRDDVDVIEQVRFRKRYQRKPKPGVSVSDDIITVQDLKDIALFTAPISFLSPMLIDVLHLPTTERFIRALILCCQYYLQIADEMALRVQELETKLRTPASDLLEKEYSENLADLRLLVAKEYCTMIVGGGDTKKYHHMGLHKKRRSLSVKDVRLFETLLRICVQIVWLALGRRCFSLIELEINRMFKSEIFNNVEHSLRTNYISRMSKEQRSVLLGQCVQQGQKLNTLSPIMNEICCARGVDFRLLGLGIVRYTRSCPRLRYMKIAVASPEEVLFENGVTVGILGMRRSLFDTMLNLLQTSGTMDATSQSTMRSSTSTRSGTSCKKSIPVKIYPDIELPPKETEGYALTSDFPEESEVVQHCDMEQCRRWQLRLSKLSSSSKH